MELIERLFGQLYTILGSTLGTWRYLGPRCALEVPGLVWGQRVIHEEEVAGVLGQVERDLIHLISRKESREGLAQIGAARGRPEKGTRLDGFAFKGRRRSQHQQSNSELQTGQLSTQVVCFLSMCETGKACPAQGLATAEEGVGIDLAHLHDAGLGPLPLHHPILPGRLSQP